MDALADGDPATLARLVDRALGEDPAQGFKFSESEYETALRVELDRGVVLTRATEQSGVDWVDQADNTYDAVGPMPSRVFDAQWSNFQMRIVGHMAKADFVPVDVTGFTPDQIAAVEQFIAPLGPQVFLVGQ